MLVLITLGVHVLVTLRLFMHCCCSVHLDECWWSEITMVEMA